MLVRTAHAKINLALHIIGQRSDGYHLLDSLVVFTQLGDQISINEAPDASSLVSLVIEGPFAKGLDKDRNNLVSQAAIMLGNQVAEKHGKPKPIEIKLTKNLPIASGMGGGSADAAATLIALQEFWGSEIKLENLALELGADVPMCLHSKPLRAQGIGDEVTSLESKAPLNIVLINPRVKVSTPEIFNRLATKNNTPIFNDQPKVLSSDLELNAMRNDLQAPAIEIEPSIQEVLNALQKTEPQLARMSGSGATCFGLYSTQQLAQEATIQLQKQNPTWWCVATTTTVS